jgi:voltage-gated potassium channel Kch
VSPLLIQLLLASAMAVLTVAIHLTGLALLTRALQAGQRLPAKLRRVPISLLIATAIGLFAIHTVEIWSYAALYLALQAVPDFEQGLYFSTVTYASIGYGDVVMAKPWRILGAIEGATGVIMLGWSTAFLVSLLAQSRLLSHDWLVVEPAEATAREQEKLR